jgi:pyruvate formate lyase activating enzyme
MKIARLYEKMGADASTAGSQKLRCLLCAHHCVLDDNRLGICKVRKNIGGELYSLNYDKVAATHNDPIEKKPLYHFLPGSTSFSIATMGCNFSCKFCQNNSLSVVHGENHIFGEAVPPEQIVQTALHYGSKSISYTYSEPTIYYELMYETARLAKEKGIKNVMVTNGYMSSEAIEEIAPYMDGANIDLKAFTESFYKKYCGARLSPVLDTIKAMKEKNIWVELTTLLIPGLNDDPKEIRELVSFIVSVDDTIPWHVSRFYPQHQLNNLPPTSPQAIFDCLKIGTEMGLKYLYAGNISADKWEDTWCPNCGELLVKRSGYFTRVQHLSDGKCGKCSHPIAGVWK